LPRERKRPEDSPSELQLQGRWCRVFISGRNHLYRHDFQAPTKLLPKPFKAQVVQECLQPGATVSSVAISHGINANVIRKWMLLYRDQSAATSLPAVVPLNASPKKDSRDVSDHRAAHGRAIDHGEMANLRS